MPENIASILSSFSLLARRNYLSLPQQHKFVFDAITYRTWLAILYLAIAGSIIAFTASFYLLSVRPPAVVGTYAYVNPVIAVLLGFLDRDDHYSDIRLFVE